MPEIKPFAALRYDASRVAGDLTGLLAPPYDVMEQSDKDALIATSTRNVVAIDLPHVPPKSQGPPETYEQSARLLREWLNDGTLIREPKPAFYLYLQDFEHGGKHYTRRMFIPRVRLHPFSDGAILAHEETFGGPKEDRLALMKATQCQLSPIFGLYTDPAGIVREAFAPAEKTPPHVVGRLEGVENKLWAVTDTGACARVAELLADRRIYIADGHHRYSTALIYRDWLRAESGGTLDDDHGANFVMFVLASMDDPGCLILPYHRAISYIDIHTVLDAWSPATEEASNGPADVIVCAGPTGAEVPLRFTDREKLATLEAQECPAWRKLDYAYLHRYLIDELLQEAIGSEPEVSYIKSADAAREAARNKSGVALLMNATPLSHLRDVSEAGGLMPQKSTYFYPKLATGLAINPLT